MLPNIIINKGQGGLGKPLPGTDYISGMLFYSGATLPSGFTSSTRCQAVYSVEQAEDLGIVDTHSGETVAVAKAVIGGTPAAGDTVAITYTGIDGAETVLATYTLTTADAVSTTTAATGIAAALNLYTPTTGFSSTSSVANLLVNTKGGEGVFPNSGTPYASVTTGGTTLTWTQPTGSGTTVLGVASDIDIMHYHISEFFRLQPKGKLWVGIYATADVGTFSNVSDMQNFAEGEIVQLGVYFKSTSFATSQCNALQTICNTLEGDHKPISSVILGAEISGTASLASLTSNLKALSDKNVSVTIAQDGANTGYHIFKATGKSITNVGEMLGAVAFAAVNESIAWVGKFQVASSELDTIAFANGQNYKDISSNQITALDTLGYNFLRKFVGVNGSYHNPPHTCVSPTSDYSFIYANRTIDKAAKNARATIMPAVSGPVKVNSDGTLAPDAIGYFKSLGKQALDIMVNNLELSGYSVIIDPTQDIVSTNTLIIAIQLLPIGVADFIEVNIGFTNVLTTN